MVPLFGNMLFFHASDDEFITRTAPSTGTASI